ncbi:hypothetical protein FNL39_101175 [Nocardia caishijiensis]|uniref:Uncharacterized protein n=1 Tax=Nocardia caishijiensis TaxID=184756 RepID=A0ABQ6YSF6_9NOCA|nr:hypothetical protein FNL39_101175 [Nocardia caishijiensis]
MRAQNQLKVFFYRRKDTVPGGQRQSGPDSGEIAEYVLTQRRPATLSVRSQSVTAN